MEENPYESPPVAPPTPRPRSRFFPVHNPYFWLSITAFSASVMFALNELQPVIGNHPIWGIPVGALLGIGFWGGILASVITSLATE